MFAARTSARRTLPARTRALLTFAPFLVLALLFAGTDWFAMRRVSRLREEASRIEDTMLVDIDLVWRIQRDLDRVKLVLDRHVFEKESAAMAILESEIDRAREDYDTAVAEYESKPLLPGEVEPWQALRAAVSDSGPRLEAALARSRVNDDAGAFRAIAQLEEDWDQADSNLLSLAEVDRRAAWEGKDRVLALQRYWTAHLQALALAGFALSLILGAAVTRALQWRNRRLQEDNRELDAFASRVAHDLKSPLGTATLAVSQLSRLAPSPEGKKAVGRLQRAFDRMNGIIEDLLALSRAQSLDPNAVCDPLAAAEELREELTTRASAADASVTIDVQPAKVRCTEGLLRQVVWNLIDNAMKYRRRGVTLHIEVSGRSLDHRYDLSVRDNGVGLSPDETARVFDPFYRGAGSKGEAGTGLGLSIVKRAVEASGGTVWVTSEPGNGSTFVARLPLV